MIEQARRWLPRILPILLLGIAGWILWREFHTLTPDLVSAEVRSWGPWRLLAAVGFTILSYSLLATLEWLGLRWAGAQVPFRVALIGSFCANAFAHTIGFAFLIGGAVRARLYSRHGASLVMVAQIGLFYGVAFGLGMVTLGGLTLVVAPQLGAGDFQVPATAVQALGVILASSPLAYVVACAAFRSPVKIAGHQISLPTPGFATAQACLGLIDCFATAAIVWVLLPQALIGFADFAGPYVVATLLGLVSHVPGGAGVFEGAVLTMLPGLPRATLAAAFLGYRLIYYAVPLFLAAALLVRSGFAAGQLAPIRRVWGSLAPALIAIFAFGLGAVLILTGIGRIAPDRLEQLKATVPAVVVESSHLLCLISGLALMSAALGLFRRRSHAATLAIAATAIGASTALLRGLDIGPAIAAAALCIVVALSRKAFQRKGNWSTDRLLSWWLAGVAAVLLGAVALGLWVYDDTPYEVRLWTAVGYHADPARFLRSVAILGAVLLGAGAWALARAGGVQVVPAGPGELSAVRALIEAADDTTARLALVGDKALLRSPDGDAFLMYGAEGRSLITMGDPVGDRAAGRALLWRLKEIADRSEARMVIYHGTPGWLIEYLDLGLTLLKLGEEARVPLEEFSLEGGRRSKLRQGHARALRDGLTFEIVAPPQGAAVLTDLRAISDAWLIDHGVHEKGFSLGRFDPLVLRQDPIALVRQEGRIVAFANIWTGGRVEASIDLMRYGPDAPNGVMDFLFLELIGWAQSEGFAWFNLGLAPLTGLAEHPLAPLWHKFGSQVARRGGRYYGFLGLRTFKAKFDPVWTPRYLAASPLSLAAAILDVTRLVGRSSTANFADN